MHTDGPPMIETAILGRESQRETERIRERARERERERERGTMAAKADVISSDLVSSQCAPQNGSLASHSALLHFQREGEREIAVYKKTREREPEGLGGRDQEPEEL